MFRVSWLPHGIRHYNDPWGTDTQSFAGFITIIRRYERFGETVPGTRAKGRSRKYNVEGTGKAYRPEEHWCTVRAPRLDENGIPLPEPGITAKQYAKLAVPRRKRPPGRPWRKRIPVDTKLVHGPLTHAQLVAKDQGITEQQAQDLIDLVAVFD